MIRDIIYTCFPITENDYDLPQDFPSYNLADKFGELNYGKGNYEVLRAC